MAEENRYQIVSGSTETLPTRWRAACQTEGIWVGPERKSYEEATNDAGAHVNKYPDHIVNIVCGA